MSHPSTDLESVPKNYGSAVNVLAAAHAEGLSSVEIFHIHDPQEKVVRLIEVSSEFPESSVQRNTQSNGTEYIVPVFPMGPAHDFPFRSEVVQITQDEWVRLRNGELKLNKDWGDLKSAVKVEHA